MGSWLTGEQMPHLKEAVATYTTFVMQVSQSNAARFSGFQEKFTSQIITS